VTHSENSGISFAISLDRPCCDLSKSVRSIEASREPLLRNRVSEVIINATTQIVALFRINLEVCNHRHSLTMPNAVIFSEFFGWAVRKSAYTLSHCELPLGLKVDGHNILTRITEKILPSVH
jgi:hypothetical protein